jgi:hypothetical protein
MQSILNYRSKTTAFQFQKTLRDLSGTITYSESNCIPRMQNYSSKKFRSASSKKPEIMDTWWTLFCILLAKTGYQSSITILINCILAVVISRGKLEPVDFLGWHSNLQCIVQILKMRIYIAEISSTSCASGEWPPMASTHHNPLRAA